ncbi:MAG: RimK family alpha-L-glutamate ligase [Gemmataceae bacterium]
MRIAVLSAGSGWHVKDLQRAAASLGHEAVAVDFRRIQAGVGIAVDSLENFDAVLVRTMPPGSLEQVIFRMDALQRVQALGVAVLNPPPAVEACVDKYLASAKIQAAGLRVPPTIACQHAEAGMEAFALLGGDVVIKPLFGSEGRGMIRITDRETAWRVLHTLERLQTVLYVQQFIRHPGWDVRVFLIGSQVAAAMRRHAHDDWRTNVAQGGRAETVDISSEQKQLAQAAMQAVHARVAGVDLMQGPDGEWYVLEVNAVPGWRALAPASGIDLATALIRFLAEENRAS